jgi:hypothetical protein
MTSAAVSGGTAAAFRRASARHIAIRELTRPAYLDRCRTVESPANACVLLSITKSRSVSILLHAFSSRFALSIFFSTSDTHKQAEVTRVVEGQQWWRLFVGVRYGTMDASAATTSS